MQSQPTMQFLGNALGNARVEWLLFISHFQMGMSELRGGGSPSPSLSLARWRMPPEELLGVVGLSSSLGKWRCQEQKKNNEKENEKGGRRRVTHLI